MSRSSILTDHTETRARSLAQHNHMHAHKLFVRRGKCLKMPNCTLESSNIDESCARFTFRWALRLCETSLRRFSAVNFHFEFQISFRSHWIVHALVICCSLPKFMTIVCMNGWRVEKSIWAWWLHCDDFEEWTTCTCCWEKNEQRTKKGFRQNRFRRHRCCRRSSSFKILMNR